MPEYQPPPAPGARRGPPPLPSHQTLSDFPASHSKVDHRPPVDELISLARSEEASVDTAEEQADLRVRLALLAWDGRGRSDDARAMLDGVEHPLAPALRLHLAIDTGDQAALARLTEDALASGDTAELVRLADLWLLRAGDPERAAAVYGAAHDARRELSLSLAHSERWHDLVSLWSSSGDPSELVAAAHVAEDRLGDGEQARSLLARAAAHPTPKSAYLVERLLEVGGEDAALLTLKLEMLAPSAWTDSALAAERAATQFRLAAALEADGNPEAAPLYAQLCNCDARFGPLLAIRAQARVEAARGNWAAAAAAWEELSRRMGDPRFSYAAARRAAELYDARVGDTAGAERIYAQLHSQAPDDGFVALALARLLLGRRALGGAAALIAEAHTGGPAEQVRAARALEAAGDARALERWRGLAALPSNTPHAAMVAGAATAALVRAARRAGDKVELGRMYRRLATVAEAREAGVYLLLAGTIALERGRLDEADQALSAALALDPRDLLAQAARALAHRTAARHADYRSSLQALLPLTRSPGGRALMLRELARVAAEQGDRASAENHYAQALALHPDDPTTLQNYARLAGDMGNWPRAVELREQAAAAAGGEQAAELLCQVGDIWATRLGDDERARAAFDRARAADPYSREALVSLAVLHRRHGRRRELLDVLSQHLSLAVDKTESLAVQLELAQVAEADPADARVAAEAYRAALSIAPDHALALAGFERIARHEGRWADLMAVLERAPHTHSSLGALESLAECYEHQGHWDRLAQNLEEQVALIAAGPEADRGSAAPVARRLARLYEERLDALDAAARAWHVVDETDGDDLEAPRALQRIYEARGRMADLAAAIEHELLRLGRTTVPPPEMNARMLELWLRLGAIRQQQLGRPDLAAEAYESSLQIDPTQQDALSALVELYTALGRRHDLERVLDLRAAVMTDPRQRAGVLLQKGDLLERSGDYDGALAAYQEAFALDPSNRHLFTALERVAYRRERWQTAMELYDKAIQLVEVQKLRAYRLADLYLRRGQVQLQYLGQPGEAAASYLRVLELDPEADTAQAALERLFSAQSDWDGLIKVYERRAELVREDARRVEVLRRAARVAAAKLRDAQQAARLYSRIHAIDPTDAEALDALERHYERVRDWEKLVEVLRTRIVLTTGGDEAIELYKKIASLCEEGLRDPAMAIESWRKILDIAPSQRDALDALARLYEGTEKWAELIDVTRRQIRIITDRGQKALLYFKCGSVMESKFGKDDDAIRYYDAAIKTSTTCLPAIHGLRDLYLRRGDWGHVIETLQGEAKVWSEDKEKAGVYARIGQIYGENLHDQERAIQCFESALAVDQECLPANRALFDLYFARRDYQRALPLGQILTGKVMREGEPAARSEFCRKRAIVALETGDPRSAADSLVAGLEVRPDNLDALDLLVGLCRSHPDAYDFVTVLRDLEKVYRKRETPRPLARVLVAQGALRERDFEIEAAEELYLEALKLAGDDYPVCEPLVDLHFRLLRFDVAAQVIEQFLERGDVLRRGGHAVDMVQRSRARMRLAEIYGDGAMDPRRAARALEALLAEDPQHRDAHFRLAQELYLLGRFPEAQRVCERLIDLAAVPGNTAPPEELARYYDYLGRIAEATGDNAAAQRSYRRAVDLNPAFPPPVLSLARRAMAQGDPAMTTTLLDEALRNAAARGEAAVRDLKRGLARLYASFGERHRALALYRETLFAPREADPSQLDDRLALAELYAREPDGLDLARAELMQVIARDIRAATAYRLLAQIYERSGQHDRAARVSSILGLLGYAAPSELPPPVVHGGRRGTLADEPRRQRLLPMAAQSLYTELLQALTEALAPMFPPPGFGPLAQVADPGLKLCVADVGRLWGVEAEVLLAQGVPGGVMAFESPRAVVVVDPQLADRPDGERRFLLGRAFEPIRGGYTLPLRLRASEREELGHLLDQALLPDGARDPKLGEFFARLPRKAARVVERLAAAAGSVVLPTIDEWFAALAEGCDRAGLLACDDVGAAARMLARIGGEELAVSAEGAVTLGQIPGGAELVRFFLSDAYHDLRVALGDVPGRR